ncbi:MAG: BrnT family toxin [Rhizobiaceae bacterium]|nr:BrnT family toxin [Rhizobiaceae bacterium]MCV0405206.1 BrnT family toxin [Rhizobiaceae bacterium]
MYWVDKKYHKAATVRFVWDDDKRKSNLEKHGVDFADAHAFEWATALVVDDDREDYGEARQVATGFVGERIYVMVFTDRDSQRRVISFRKANKREIRSYVESIQS